MKERNAIKLNAAGAPAVDPASMIIQAGAVIAQTVAGISDMNKRRAIEANLAYLSDQGKLDLARAIARTNNANEQATILINTVMAARNAAADRDQKKEIVKWVLLGSAGIVTLAILAWYLKRK